MCKYYILGIRSGGDAERERQEQTTGAYGKYVFAIKLIINFVENIYLYSNSKITLNGINLSKKLKNGQERVFDVMSMYRKDAGLV